MLRLVPALVMLLVAADARAAGDDCPIEGDVAHWAADYCMASIGTDDEIAASDCLWRERERTFESACSARLYYKRAMCELAMRYHAGVSSVATCLADRDFVGRTVRERGVGK